jgi:hypothetical protein
MGHVRRTFLLALGAPLALVLSASLAACGDDATTEAPPAAAVSLGTTSTTLSPDDPPVVIGGAPGPDGHLPVRLNPEAWEDVVAEMNDDDVEDPYYELHTEGHDDFWFGVELHTVVGPGWTGELGLFATDCRNNGLCVYFDPDGGAGPSPPLLASANGEIDVVQLEDGISLTFRNLVFEEPGRPGYRVDSLHVEAD